MHRSYFATYSFYFSFYLAVIAKKKCVPHGGLRWRPVGRVNAAWVLHGDHTQRLKRLKRLERRRNVM
jgi:hypothetical protein